MKSVQMMMMAEKAFTKGKYTIAELNQMIYVDGYIPVASGAELNAIRSNKTGYRMGVGTLWDGVYTFSTASKFVQVSNISLIDYQSGYGWERININSASVYDGNELDIKDLLINETRMDNIYIYTGLFGYVNGSILNVRCYGTITRTSAGKSYYATGGIAAFLNETSLFANNHFYGNVTGVSYIGGIVGVAYRPISDCKMFGNVTSTAINDAQCLTGGVVGFGGWYFSAENCHIIGNVTGQRYMGGFIGMVGNTIVAKTYIKKCSVVGDVTSLADSDSLYGGEGGFIGRNGDTKGVEISECFVKGDMIAPNRSNCAGFGISGYADFKHCYMIGNVTASTSRNNGTYNACVFGVENNNIENCYFVGVVTGYAGIKKVFKNFGNGIFTHSYWNNEVDAITGSDGGLGKTTSELQTGTIPDTAIFVDWDALIWKGNGSSNYPTLINNPE